LSEAEGFTTSQLGLLDVALLLPYAVAQIALGSLGDRYGARLVLSLSLILSGVSMLSFGVWNSFTMLCLLLFINGLAQVGHTCEKNHWYLSGCCGLFSHWRWGHGIPLGDMLISSGVLPNCLKTFTLKVDAHVELCSPLLKGGNSVFNAAIGVVFFLKKQYWWLKNYGPNGIYLLKLSNLMIFTFS